MAAHEYRIPRRGRGMEQGVGVESRLARHGCQETGSGPPKRAVNRASRENTSGGRGVRSEAGIQRRRRYLEDPKCEAKR
ncbi:hypothetical protein E2C01_072920 [Portunus trituberculatus]|uniref:Uncharacterized protein n=1 Tax=Portunus trituberculatus TaxID=210409 RepID=A0A5B7ICN4_PORTR|nr:hypothetical protein [Portunus trituberculatus]